MRFSRFLLNISLAMPFACGSCGGSTGSAGLPDAWARWIPAGKDVGFEDVPATRFRIVDESKQAAAVRLLEQVPLRVLNPDEEKTLLDDQLLERGHSEIVILIRGLVAEDDGEGNAKRDKLTIRWRADAIVARYIAWRSHAVERKRRAILVVVPNEPRDAYVESAVAIMGANGR